MKVLAADHDRPPLLACSGLGDTGPQLSVAGDDRDLSAHNFLSIHLDAFCLSESSPRKRRDKPSLLQIR